MYLYECGCKARAWSRKMSYSCCKSEGDDVSVAILLIAYGTLVEVGGVMGFVKAKSRVSLIAGVASGGILTISGVLVWLGVASAIYAGFAMTIILCFLFGRRFAKTRAVMPSGMMLIVSLAAAIILGLMLIS